jgi:CRISPR-associated endonuclease Csn1
MTKILGLDLGTNSIGWALIDNEENIIIDLDSRIIPMSQAILGKFDSGITESQTAKRTGFRGTRRLHERQILRRERLHRVLHVIGFLPEHFDKSIDFEKKLGKFLTDTEPKLSWKEVEKNRFEFIFKTSFNEMIQDFKISKPELFESNSKGEERKIPYDWTIYYLRKKALQAKIEKEELAWLLLNFNQKRGYYQLRGEEEEETPNKLVEYHTLKVKEVIADELQKGKTDRWYSVILENGWIYRRSSKIPLFDWKDKIKDFIVTTDLNDDGTVKVDKEGMEKRSFRAPSEEDWTLVKKKTESFIDDSKNTVGCFIYNTLLQNPAQKINGRLVRTIERNYYKQELKAILEKQKEYHVELQNTELYKTCLEELYKNNEAHRKSIAIKDLTHLFLNDIIFYQRPLKSKKSLISNCKYEYREFKDDTTGEIIKEQIKCVAKSHPLYQELRLWKFVKDLRIFEIEKLVDGKLKTEVDVTLEFLKSEDDYVALFDWLNNRNLIKQDTLLSSHFKIKKKKGNDKLPFRWNYVVDKEYPCNETRSQMLSRLSKISNIPEDFLDKEKELALWHILYSVVDKFEVVKALKSYAIKHHLGDEFVEAFRKIPPFKKEYGAYSVKAIKKLLPLMRMGKYWDENAINQKTKQRIDNILTGEFDENIHNRVREKAISLKEFFDFKGLPEWLACYIVYDRHSEAKDVAKWKTPHDLNDFIREFKQNSLRNPIVEQVIIETLRTVRDIWRKYGDFSEIHVELGREMKNPADKRKSMTEKNSENENTNLRIKALLAELVNHNDVENVRPYSPSQQEILKIYEEGVINSGIEIREDIAKIIKTSQPSKSDLTRYKLWLDQKYRSPYTGEMIPLGKLFTSAYEIEHIIPQKRYFDDSLSNKVICETEVNNVKGNALGYEFIKKNEGRIIELSYGKSVKLFTIAEYEEFVKQHYSNSKARGKMKKLLMEDIPDLFIDRQLNDSRYISKVVMSLLSNIVREESEQEVISKNVISCTGFITDTLKQNWGLHDVWNRIITPRFERMNELTESNHFGQWTNKEGKRVFQTEMPLELQKGFNRKRIDHRHHAMDALVIACATRSHVNYLNNESAKSSAKETRFDLKNKLCQKKYDDNKNYKWEIIKPWNTFTQDAQDALGDIVVSFKQNLRVINKTVNKYQCYKDGKKIIETQVKGDSWAIRKPLHKETFYGIVNLRLKKSVRLSSYLDQWENLVDKNLKTKIKQLINEGFDKKKIQKYFADQENKWMGKDITTVEIYYFSNDNEVLVASREKLDDTFNSKKIESITDTGIKQILQNHLDQTKYQNQNDVNGKTIAPETLAFSAEGIEEMNQNIRILNKGKFHQPIYKVRTYSSKGNKFNVGSTGNKKDKYVVAAPDTNLFFAIYVDEDGTRNFETIPLNIVIERLKQRENPVETTKLDDKGKEYTLHSFLCPNDIVYLPTEEQINNWSNFKVSDIDKRRIYRFIDSSDTTANFVPVSSASILFNLNKSDQDKKGIKYPIQNEFGVGSPQSKNQKALTGEMIKNYCIKLKIDRLGKISI